MKKAGIMAAAAILILASCNKNELEPVTGYNSRLELQNLLFYNLLLADSVRGNISVQFLVTNDTTTVPDTVRINQVINIGGPSSNQTIHFNTPDKATRASFDMRFQVYGGGGDSVHIENLSYIRNDATLFSRPVYFNNGGDLFTTPTITHNF